MNINEPITSLKGIGDSKAKSLAKIGVYTVGDILLHYPRTYYIYKPPVDETELNKYVGEKVAVTLTLQKGAALRKTRRFDIVLATGYTENLSVDLIWFRTAYIRNSLYTHTPIVFFGRLTEEYGKFKMEQPEVYTPKEYENLCKKPYPIYSITKGVSNKLIIKTVHTSLQDVEIKETLPKYVIDNNNLPSIKEALASVHTPNSLSDYYNARKRLAFDEIFKFVLGVEYNNANTVKTDNNIEIKNEDEVNALISNLPYELTNGQKDALNDIIKDFKSPYVNQRLIQGDVGSGKTIVAFLAMLTMVSNGYQAAIMAPTEVLARQHENDFKKLIEDNNLKYKVVCLTGSTKAKERREINEIISNDNQVFIIGTHALIQEKVEYCNLGLVVTDEQHRFGVKQREAFSNKGFNPFTVVMSATPIPRTLSMIIYCGMDISVIKDVPKIKLPIKNCVIKENMRSNAYKHILSEIKKGHQAYIICPLVEAKEITEAENVIDYKEKLSDYIPSNVNAEILHGKMKAKDKNDIMDRFNNGEIDILISTTVVEVGVNNPNATTIMIENADRFGLAQLHQLRGRVGRGSAQSYCIFMDSTDGTQINKRLAIMNTSNDGFFIANEDLKFRGPGDILGIRQSGDMNFKIADIYNDADLFTSARNDIEKLIKDGYTFTELGLNDSNENVL
ncbi:MAG: ATP-dependent DNA helicase RecG [Lachnospiraceae bacterium]|nr:ATP-dependent DNA helicase RecG [Lachnospiraceae bacterium]